jgi:hypothetical protein
MLKTRAKGGFYQRLTPEPVRMTCSRCGQPSATVRIADMLCIVCWMRARAEARGEKFPEQAGER